MPSHSESGKPRLSWLKTTIFWAGRGLGWTLRAALLIAFLTAVVIRLRYRDILDAPYSTLFYLSRLPIVAVLPIPEWAWQVFRRKRLVLGAILSFCIAIPATCWIWDSHRNLSDPTAPKGDVVRIVFWNADHFGKFGIPESALELAQYDPDFLLLNEGIADYGTQKRVFPQVYPEHEMKFLPWGRFSMIRNGKVERQHFSQIGQYNATLNQTIISVGGRRLILLMYDHKSNPKLSRRPALEALYEAALHYHKAGYPTIILGDFNTPVDSTHLSPLRTVMRNGFETVGHGFQETWPMPLPVLSLDQVWVSKEVRPLRCFHVPVGNSRHKAVVFDFDLWSQLPPTKEADQFPAPYDDAKRFPRPPLP